jgi:hypothetical protein
MPDGIINAFQNDRLELTVCNAWLQSYVMLLQQSQAFKLTSTAAAQQVAGSVLAKAMSGLSLIGGPLAFVLSTLGNLAKTILAAFKLGEAVTADNARSDEINAKIYNILGPPPAIFDDLLLHGLAVAQTWITKLADYDPRNYDKLVLLFSEPPVYLEFGALMLLAELKTLGSIQPPPLLKDQLQIISNLWCKRDRPVKFLNLDYMIEGPPWLRAGTRDLEGEAKTRSYELRGLTAYYKNWKQIGLFHLNKTAPKAERAISDKTRFAMLKQAVGLA